VHRIGRTGRAGSEGEAVSLVCVDERALLAGIERLLGRELPRRMLGGFEPDPSIRAEPIETGRRAAQPKGHVRKGGERHGRRSRGTRMENRRTCP
jgi:ATP-dependent RNA helicase RhlE